ncbi:EAL domain-containing response regulator [Pseudomonas sp. ERGC3:05]|nr:EAL domain-containing response regulator [Pseudomonas sp. ERGC3:01]QZC92678.1 EAL domain-containing response regulator [Pseudomonas sp. ERGC3:05]
MRMLSLRILVFADTASSGSRLANLLRQTGCQQVFVATDSAQALAILERAGAMDITLCHMPTESSCAQGLLQIMGRSELTGSVIISHLLSADMRSALGQLISLLGMTLVGSVSKPLQAGALKYFPAMHLNEPINESGLLPVLPATEEEVRRALSSHQLHTYFQPKFNLQTGEVSSVEALARWHHPFKGVLPPSVFMSVIERCGLLNELLLLQLEQCLRLQRQAINQGFALNVALNLHAGQLIKTEFLSQIQGILAAHDLPGSGLTFELSEAGLLEEPAISLESLVRLRMMGCSLSIDDFGAGFSSLQRLCQLPFNEIKVDGEFVRGLQHEPRRRAVISSTLALGEALGMSVIVEGIETEEQRKILLELGCKQGQGYLCARPMSAVSLLRWLEVQRGVTASC